jgi:hypothetical protein
VGYSSARRLHCPGSSLPEIKAGGCARRIGIHKGFFAHEPQEISRCPGDNLEDTVSGLVGSLSSFDYDSVSQTIAHLIDSIRNEPTPFPPRSAVRVLRALRRKRQYTAIVLFSEAIVQSGGRAPEIVRYYAQALIDQGMLTAAEFLLKEFRTDSTVSTAEQAEIRGLLGRVYKQIYVSTAAMSSVARKRDLLMRSVEEYAGMYASSRGEHTWHGINTVALLARAERDEVDIHGGRDYRLLAREILSRLSRKESEMPDGFRHSISRHSWSRYSLSATRLR